MKPVLKPVSSPFLSDSIERILSRYYQQLVGWSRMLARGDHAAAEESVQDLCLHLTVAQPDLNRINNLDNYLFTCLRNMYVSNLARVSRERLRAIQVEDYDAVGMVAVDDGSDAVDVQNELIRICDFVTSRKYSSKSASHFILHSSWAIEGAMLLCWRVPRSPPCTTISKMSEANCEGIWPAVKRSGSFVKKLCRKANCCKLLFPATCF